MTTPNPRWARWIVSSVAKYFQTNVATVLSIPYLVEGVDNREDSFDHAPTRAELRFNGPFSRELSKGYWKLWFDINILVTANQDGSVTNRYTLENTLGAFLEYADTCIPINQNGDPLIDPTNDGSLLGYLSPRSTKNDSVRIIHFGQINKVDRIRQGQVDGRYEMYLCVEET